MVNEKFDRVDYSYLMAQQSIECVEYLTSVGESIGPMLQVSMKLGVDEITAWCGADKHLHIGPHFRACQESSTLRLYRFFA